MGGDLRSIQGQSAVELALLLPIILLICAGIVDFGRAYRYDIVVTNAARVGARASADIRNSDSAIRAATKAEAAPITILDGDIAISPAGSRSPGDTAMVTVSYTFTPITPLIGSLFSGGSIIISKSAAMVAF